MMGIGLQNLVAILKSPDGSPLRIEGSSLVSDAGQRWPIVDGAPNFLDMDVAERSEHVSHSIPQAATDLIAKTEGLVLNLSAGGTTTKAQNVVEMEWGLYRNTDVSADAHDLPFADEVFDGVICLNSFEHYHDPLRVVAEIERVLKPGGFVYVLTAFLQPFHMKPHHYFNVTTSGLRKWFSPFDIEHLGATEFHNVMLALQWIGNSALWALELKGPLPEVQGITLADLRDGWQGNPPANVRKAHALAAALPQELRDDAAQALAVLARKRTGDQPQKVSENLPQMNVIKPETLEEPVSGAVPEVAKTILLCFDSRTGSHLLSHYMAETGLLGVPGEYFNVDGKPAGYPRHPRSQMKTAKQLATSSNGVFSFKIDPVHLAGILPYVDLRTECPSPTFVEIKRNDILRQAISLVRAQQTGIWATDSLDQIGEPAYDGRRILQAMRDLVLRRERWTMYFARNAISPVVISFEEIIQDYKKCVSKICAAAGIDWQPSDLQPPPEYKQQADDLSREWRERFIREHSDLQKIDMLP